MIAIETDDGEMFTISKQGIKILLSRNELETLLDEGGILLLVTSEREIVAIDET